MKKKVLLHLQVYERMRIDVWALTELTRPEVKSLVLKAHMAERLFKVLFIFCYIFYAYSIGSK